jgi:hypothetical protein
MTDVIESSEDPPAIGAATDRGTVVMSDEREPR